MLQPKRTKFRKTQKGRNRGLAQVNNRVSFGAVSYTHLTLPTIA